MNNHFAPNFLHSGDMTPIQPVGELKSLLEMPPRLPKTVGDIHDLVARMGFDS